MQSESGRAEYAMRLRQGMVLQDNYVQPENEHKHRTLDDFFLYTSVSGLRFLHSRHPIWFQFISAGVLVLSLTLSAYHSWSFVARFLQPGHPAQMTTQYYREVNAPNVIVCPYSQFRMVQENYTGDFAYLLTHVWHKPALEPRISRRPLSRFLDETADQISVFLNQKADTLNVDLLTNFSSQLSRFLPEVSALLNVSQALRVFDPKFRLDTYDEYVEQKIQNDSCYQEFGSTSLAQFYGCRLTKARRLLERTNGNLAQLKAQLKRPPSVDGFILEWWDGGGCRHEVVETPFGISCLKLSGQQSIPVTPTVAFLTTEITIDTQVFNNQADGWEKNEIRVALVESGTSMPNTSNYFRATGGTTLDLEINSFTDFYYRGSCSKEVTKTYASVKDGEPTEEACMWRRYNVDYSVTPYGGSDKFYEQLRPKRENTWRLIDSLVQESVAAEVYAPQLTQEVGRLFRDYFEATLLLGKIVQSTQLLNQSRRSILISKACAESPLIQDARQKVEDLFFWINEVEKQSSNKTLSVGLTNSVRDDSRPVTTKFIRFYSDPKNIALLGDYFEKLYELLTDLRNRLVPGSVCLELVASVRQFLTVLITSRNPAASHYLQKTSMVRRTTFNDKQSVLENRLTSLVKKRDAQLIFKDYAKQNFMAVRVHFRHLYGEVISSASEYTTFMLIADLGCTMSLYFGLSVLTFFEFLVYVFVKDAAEGTVPPPHRDQIYNPKTKSGKEERKLSVVDVPPPAF